MQYGYDALDTDVERMMHGGGTIRRCIRKRGFTDPYCRLVKEAVDVPVLCAGMENPGDGFEAVEAGECDV